MSATLTLSGNEITDTVRAAATSGDGLPPDGSIGIWEATTNLCTNGGFETNTTGWTTTGLNSFVRATNNYKFGTASGKGVGDAAGDRAAFDVSCTTGQTYTYSAWVYIESLSATGIFLRIADNGGAGPNVFVSPDITTIGSWVKSSITFTAASTSTHQFQVRQQGAGNVTFYVDGVQVEQQPLATPYVETNGSTASRTISRVQFPVANILDETQGWVACRVRSDWPHTGEPHQFPGLFRWADNNNERFEIYFELVGNWIYFDRRTGGAGNSRAAAVSWSAGQDLTFLAAWTATHIRLSVNGGAFVETAQTSIPTLSASLAEIGNGHSSGAVADLNYYWFACGLGTVSNAQAAAIHGIGNADVTAWQWPIAMQTTLVWDAKGSGTSATAYGPDDKPQWAIYPPLGGILYPPVAGVV